MNSNVALDSNTDELQELQRKAAEARAQREAAEAKRERELQSRELKAQLEQDAQAVKDLELIEKFEVDLGPEGRAFTLVRTAASGSIVVSRPHMNTYRKFQETGKHDWPTLQKLVHPCLKHPTKAEFEKILEDEPQVLIRCANAIATLAGVTKEEVQKG